MQTAYQHSPPEVVRVLALPPGEKRNAGLNELANRYHGQLETFIRCELRAVRFHQYLDPQDLVQSLYVKLITVEPQEQIGDEKHLLNWLQCVLRNHMLEKAKALKARKRDVSRMTALTDDTVEHGLWPVSGRDDHRPGMAARSTSPAQEVKRKEGMKRYREFLREAERVLPYRDWELFRRHHLEGVQQSVLADEMDRTASAICQRLRRICNTLAASLPQYAELIEE